MKYKVCDRCSVALTNGDYTAFDETELSLVMPTVDSMGNVTYSYTEHEGYFPCYVCSDVAIDANIYVKV